MALAVLKYKGNRNGKHRFSMYLGSNKYYQYAIGTKEFYSNKGIKTLAAQTYVSPILGPEKQNPIGLGEIILEVPENYFTKDNSYIQLMSFKTKNKKGPAISNIVYVRKSFGVDTPLPNIQFSMENSINQEVYHVPFQFKETPYSESLFFKQLVALIPKALPVIEKLVGGAKKSKNEKGKIDILKLLSDPESMKGITDALKQLLDSTKKSEQQSVSMTVEHYSQAQMAWLAMIPQILDSLKEFGQMGLELNQQENDLIKALNPGVEDEAGDALLASLSYGALRPSGLVQFRRLKEDKVSLSFTPGTTKLNNDGNETIHIVHNEEVKFPTLIKTIKPISKGIIHTVVKRPLTNEIVAEFKQKFNNQDSGLLNTTPYLPVTEADNLIIGEEYILCINVIWKNNKNENIGSTVKAIVKPLAAYSYLSKTPIGESIPLNNLNAYRPFWHKFWQGDFTSEVKRYEYQCKYYYSLEGDRNNIARMETVSMLEPDRPHKMTGKMKGGVILNPKVLNDIIPIISEYDKLSSKQLKAITVPLFTKDAHQSARTSIAFKGKANEMAALWVYPELTFHEVSLQKIRKADENGIVKELSTETVLFPLPTKANFVGLKSN